MAKSVWVGILGLLAFLCQSAYGAGADFSADMVQKNLKDQKEYVVGKLFMSHGRQRTEMAISDQQAAGEYGHVLINVLNPAKGTMWQIFPDKKIYWERKGNYSADPPPLPGDSRHPCAQTLSCTKLGDDTVAGRQTEKWQISMKQEGQSSLVWVDPKLGIPVREEITGLLAKELRNVKEEPQPDSLFEVPAGFQKVDPPAPPTGSQSSAPSQPPR